MCGGVFHSLGLPDSLASGGSADECSQGSFYDLEPRGIPLRDLNCSSRDQFSDRSHVVYVCVYACACMCLCVRARECVRACVCVF